MVPKYIKENANDVVFILEYNAERSHLIIPEYGRHLQKLIDLAVAIEDKTERNKAAKYIIQVMGSLNPVSYTHLDVYKRQVVVLVINRGIYNFHIDNYLISQ